MPPMSWSAKTFRRNYLNSFKGPFGIDASKLAFRADGFKASLRIDGQASLRIDGQASLRDGFKDSFDIV